MLDATPVKSNQSMIHFNTQNSCVHKHAEMKRSKRKALAVAAEKFLDLMALSNYF